MKATKKPLVGGDTGTGVDTICNSYNSTFTARIKSCLVDRLTLYLYQDQNGLAIQLAILIWVTFQGRLARW